MAGMKCMLGIASKTDDFDYDKFFRKRVNAVVQQFDEFHETYGIKEGDGMYLAPDDRVSVW